MALTKKIMLWTPLCEDAAHIVSRYDARYSSDIFGCEWDFPSWMWDDLRHSIWHFAHTLDRTLRSEYEAWMHETKILDDEKRGLIPKKKGNCLRYHPYKY